MKAKNLIVPILVVALLAAISAPAAQAELVTLTVVLAAAFASAIVIDEVVNSDDETKTASKPDEPDSNKHSSAVDSKLEPARQ